ncbi:MAG TPA: GNAT family N-acetyltransferase [Vicinamibacterales bacterium]|nr:GNAT family N-acetyltransferase [Vicinamibacterales bacterium]
MFERYNERARRALFFARYEVSRLGASVIDTEHVLLGLIRQGRGLLPRILELSDVSPVSLRREIEGRTVAGEPIPTSVEIPFSAQTQRVLGFAAEEADRLLHEYIGPEHLLLGLLREDTSDAALILTSHGLRLDDVRMTIVKLLAEPSSSGRTIRRAQSSDVEAIAEAHRDSILSIGPAFYPPEDVAAWAEGLNGDVYLKAMDRGEVFFIATGEIGGATRVLGFASDYRLEGATHGTSVYVRGGAARRGIGTALLRMAEAHAVANGATGIRIEASLAGVEFYRARGYVEIGEGETRLMSGHPIACVFMRKDIRRGDER